MLNPQHILIGGNPFFVFIAVNLALNPLNKDDVFDGDMTTHRSINAATVNLNGMFIVNAFILHTSMKKKNYITTLKKVLYPCFNYL